MLNVDREPLMEAHEAVLEIAARARECMGQDKYGSQYIRNAFDPHVSLAKVDYRDQARAELLGRQEYGELVSVSTRALELCDIGERSELWEVLTSVPK